MGGGEGLAESLSSGRTEKFGPTFVPESFQPHEHLRFDLALW